MGGKWALEKKLKWQREKRKSLKEIGKCINHCFKTTKNGQTICEDCLIKKRKQTNIYRAKIKKETIQKYGRICSCCGESNIEFLTISHTWNDGGKQRKELKIRAGIWFYCWLKKQNFPMNLGLTVHCYNCNCSRGAYGYCPHERK